MISIVDCDLCVTLPHNQKVLELPLPETWGRLSTILTKGGWEGQDRWSPNPARYASALDIEEVRVCRSCGTHYHYRQDHDPHSGEPRPSETDWFLERVTLTQARTFVSRTGLNRVTEYLDGGWLDQRYETIIGLLRRDLLRASNWQIKRYMVESLYNHYVSNQDWESLRATLIESPDPAVRVYVASAIFWQTDPGGMLHEFSPEGFDRVNAIRRAEPMREPLLVAVIAGGLSEQGQSLFSFPPAEPVAVFGNAMHSLRQYVPRRSLAPAIPALAAALQRTDSPRGWREAGRDLLMEYVGAAPKRAKEVLEALAGDTDEALAVRTHCQRCLEQSAR